MPFCSDIFRWASDKRRRTFSAMEIKPNTMQHTQQTMYWAVVLAFHQEKSNKTSVEASNHMGRGRAHLSSMAQSVLTRMLAVDINGKRAAVQKAKHAHPLGGHKLNSLCRKSVGRRNYCLPACVVLVSFRDSATEQDGQVLARKETEQTPWSVKLLITHTKGER